jgi:hypothetical protein
MLGNTRRKKQWKERKKRKRKERGKIKDYHDRKEGRVKESEINNVIGTSK